jgi:uncharacterized protein (TIGR00661 family)
MIKTQQTQQKQQAQQASILWGICGIGHGHTFRQLPLLQHFADEGHKIMVFAYGQSLETLTDIFRETPNVSLAEVAVPYYVGAKDGLDFEATQNHPANQNIDFQGINARAMAQAQKIIGCPDLVVTDYEPVSAQYAYAHNAPLVTIDQQSKYLKGDFPQDLNGCGFRDEVERLRMFFPKADHRIACSFFDVAACAHAAQDVTIHAPVLREEIIALQREPSVRPSYILYLTAQMETAQSLADLFDVLSRGTEADFHVFGRNVPAGEKQSNISCHGHAQQGFLRALESCHGIISTAGHGLLSEAMYLGIPVYAMPLSLYEQQMNAKVINDHGFGMARPTLERASLQEFMAQNANYCDAIGKDQKILMRKDERAQIVKTLRAYLK